MLGGLSEIHLDIKVDILRRVYKVDANMGASPSGLSREADAPG